MPGLIVHEWLAQTGGSENVLEQMLATLPDADLLVLWNDRVPSDRPVQETWLARTPLRRHKALALPFEVPTWRYLRAEKSYEWMLVSSHLFAHHARLRSQSDTPKHVYAHTPARYIWSPDLDRRGAAPHIKVASALLKPIDRKRAQEAVSIAANSEFTRDRIRRAWNRDAEVIYPPVNVERIRSVSDWRDSLTAREEDYLSALPADFLLGASRMIPYKRLDAVIDAGEATQVPVVLAGAGPLWASLKSRAERSTVPVHMVHRPSDELLFALYQRARAFVFPAIEDFGIMPIEAMACGAPVIVTHEGGAAETARLTGGGAIVESFEPSEWRHALSLVDAIDRRQLPDRVDAFSLASFRVALLGWLPMITPDKGSEEAYA